MLVERGSPVTRQLDPSLNTSLEFLRTVLLFSKIFILIFAVFVDITALHNFAIKQTAEVKTKKIESRSGRKMRFVLRNFTEIRARAMKTSSPDNHCLSTADLSASLFGE